MIAASSIRVGSQTRSMLSVARFTETCRTPARPETTFSIRDEQAAQCMPRTARRIFFVDSTMIFSRGIIHFHANMR